MFSKTVGHTLPLILLLALFAPLSRAQLVGTTITITPSATAPVTISPNTASTAVVGAGFEFSECIGPNSNNCISSGLFVGVDISATQIQFGMSGATFNCAGGAFQIVLSGLPTFSSISYISGSLSSGTFALASTTANSATFQGSCTSGFSAVGGANFVFNVLFPPPTLSKSFTPPTVLAGQNSALVINIGNPNTFPLTNVAFTETLPAGLILATPLAVTNSCGGVLTAAGRSMVLSAGTIAAGTSCNVTALVTGLFAGSQKSATSAVTSAEVGNSVTATASLLVIGPPSIGKTFGSAVFPINGTTTLTFTLTNPNATNMVASVTDALPAGLVVATPNGLNSSNCISGNITAVAASSSISLASMVIAANSACVVKVNVTGTTAGVKVNTTSAITSVDAGTGNVASATTVVALPPSISKAFDVAVTPLNGVTTLTFNIGNPNAATALTGVGFTDNLPAGLKVATPSVITNSCSGTVTAVAGSGTISLTGGGPLAPASSCTVTAQVTGVATGLQVNVTDPVTSIEGGTGNTATASLTIGGNFLVSYAANLTSGDSVINLTNTGANGAALTGPGFAGGTGNICVNVYAFSPDEQLVSCCSCPITPNGLASLSVTGDLINNTLTGVKPNSVVVKLVVTGAGATFTGTTCANSAAVAGQNVANPLLATGGLAFGTTLHVLGAGFVVTENPFRGATLSAQELASITNRCTNIIGNGSGFGVCKSCRPGGLDNTNR